MSCHSTVSPYKSVLSLPLSQQPQLPLCATLLKCDGPVTPTVCPSPGSLTCMKPMHWVTLRGDANGTQQKPQSLWVILKCSVSPWQPANWLRKRLDMLISKPNASKQYHQSPPARFSCFYREPSHHLSISVTLWFCGNCHFTLLQFPRP